MDGGGHSDSGHSDSGHHHHGGPHTGDGGYSAGARRPGTTSTGESIGALVFVVAMIILLVVICVL